MCMQNTLSSVHLVELPQFIILNIAMSGVGSLELPPLPTIVKTATGTVIRVQRINCIFLPLLRYDYVTVPHGFPFENRINMCAHDIPVVSLDETYINILGIPCSSEYTVYTVTVSISPVRRYSRKYLLSSSVPSGHRPVGPWPMSFLSNLTSIYYRYTFVYDTRIRVLLP